ncbi:MAG: 4,5-DOPA dioxygenase extradiol [Planctomycetes bacterium]|nr:4,5-DOPA dioxygenase extradiol [Planctomycetota bacterium]
MDETTPTPTRMPVLFVGHGSPMNAIEDNEWSRAFRAIGEELPRPRAVLAVSAHWWTRGSFLTGGTRPRTIHDFGGFPPALYEVQYPAPGSPDLAARVQTILAQATSPDAAVKDDWGLDHGSWSVLRHLMPAADVPVVQLSLDGQLSGKQHFELARALHQLRGEGVLILGSGNITHNLRDAMSRASSGNAATPDWAEQFDTEVAQALRERDSRHLIAAWPDGQYARSAHPHPDHWFPLLYAVAATDDEDEVRFPVEGFDLGSLSMRAVRWG